MASETRPGWLKVKTTLPIWHLIPPNAARKVFRTDRLIIRPMTQDDLPVYHSMRTCVEGMIFTGQGRIDQSLEETQRHLDRLLPPNDINFFVWGICLASTGKLIGIGGVYSPFLSHFFGWPEIGYMFEQKHWGKGYATEFVKAFVQDIWCTLPRSDVEIEVDGGSVAKGVKDGDTVPEMLSALIEAPNTGSQRVMQRCGWELFKEWDVEDDRTGFEGRIASM
ncbi:hypothetical protein HDU93_004765, partial [Gonapodya sp. JEL0774]